MKCRYCFDIIVFGTLVVFVVVDDCGVFVAFVVVFFFAFVVLVVANDDVTNVALTIVFQFQSEDQATDSDGRKAGGEGPCHRGGKKTGK